MQSEISDFISGMNEVSGLWDLVKKNPTIFKDMFCCKPNELNKDVFDTLYTVELSLHGSNQRAGEEQTIYLFESFLQDIEGILILT